MLHLFYFSSDRFEELDDLLIQEPSIDGTPDDDLSDLNDDSEGTTLMD
jgi:hypothetical protein